MASRWVAYGWDGDEADDGREEDVAAEMPLTFLLDGEEFATVVCSPADLEDLTVGFLASEGVIRQADDIRSLDIDEARGIANVSLLRRLDAAGDHSRRFIGSCCGKSRQFYLRSDVRTARTSRSRVRLTPERCYGWMEALQRLSADFQATGGVHNAALADASSPELLAFRADIGRHNALDKLYGHCLRRRIPAADLTVVFSGRLSSEVVLKAAKIGVGVLLSKSAPTDLALRLADDLGLTCAGFVRERRMNVYTHPERIGPC